MSQIKKLLIIFGLVVLSLPMIAFFTKEGTTDMSVWLEWASHIDRWGPLNAYSIINTNHDYERSDYPPLSFINLWLALEISAARNVSWMMGIKTIILVYYLATWISLIYLASLFKHKRFWMRIVAVSGLYLGTLFFIVNSEAFSYLDITYAPFIIFSLAFFARRKYLLSGIAMALAILVKWLPMIILPAFIFYFISKKGVRYRMDLSSIFKFSGGIFLIFGLLTVGFLLNHLSLLSLLESLEKAFGHGFSLSLGALNFHWLVGYIVKIIYPSTYIVFTRDNIQIFQLISAVIFVVVIIEILNSFIKRKSDIGGLLQTSLMISWSYFIWRTGVHENHLFISVLIALCIAIINTNWENIRQYLVLSFFGLANLIVFFGFPVVNGSVAILSSFTVIPGVHLTEVLAALHVLIYLVYLRKYVLSKK